jgi:hypothetical protein
MRKFFPVLAATAFVMASSHAFAGTQVKASIVSPNGDPKVVTTCLGGGPKNADGSCPNAINGTAQVSGKKGIQITLKDMTTPIAATKKDLIDNSGTCDPTNASAVACYMSIVKASANGLDVQLNLPTQIIKGKAKVKVPFSGALASTGFAGATVGLSGGETRQAPAPADQVNCLLVLSGGAYSAAAGFPVAEAVLAGVFLTPLDLAGVFVPGIAFDGGVTDNPCASGLLVGVAGVYNGN